MLGYAEDFGWAFAGVERTRVFKVRPNRTEPPERGSVRPKGSAEPFPTDDMQLNVL